MYDRLLKKMLLGVHPDKGYRSHHNRSKLDIIYGALASIRAERSQQKQKLLYEDALSKIRSIEARAYWEKEAARAVMNDVLRRQRVAHETHWAGLRQMGGGMGQMGGVFRDVPSTRGRTTDGRTTDGRTTDGRTTDGRTTRGRTGRGGFRGRTGRVHIHGHIHGRFTHRPTIHKYIVRRVYRDDAVPMEID